MKVIKFHQKLTKEVARAIRFSGLGVRSVGPVGDFLEKSELTYYQYYQLPSPCLLNQHIASQKTHGHHRAEFATDTATGNSATLAGSLNQPPPSGEI